MTPETIGTTLLWAGAMILSMTASVHWLLSLL